MSTVLALHIYVPTATLETQRSRAQSRVQIVLGLLPSIAVLALVIAFADITALLMGGRDVSWVAAAYGWPALVVLVAAALMAATATLIFRHEESP